MATHNSLAGTLKRALIGNYRLGAKNRQSLNQSVANIHFNNPNDYIKTLNYSYYHNIYSPLDRYTRYADFEAMDDVPEIHTALNIYADNATVKNEYDDILEIISEDDKILEALENLFYSRLDVESMLWNIVRNLCKYGDYFAFIDLMPEVGVTSLFTLPVQLVEREEGYDGDPRSVRFKLNAHSSGYGNSMMSYSFVNNSSSEQHYDYYQIAHFRLLGDDRYLPFSRSVLDSARRVYKQLMMIEDAMLIYRIARAPERRVFKINVGGIPAKDVEAYIKKVMSIMQGTNIMDSTGKLDTRYAPMSTIDNYYLPVRGNQDGSNIESLPGGENTAAIDDVKYIQKKLMMSLGVPKSFLGDESELSSKCLDLNTKIPLLNGQVKTLSELIVDYSNGIKNYVYSIDNATMNVVPGEIEWAGITKRNTQVVEVILDNGEKIVCTPDHKFLTRDNIYVEAKDLVQGQSLMPYYTDKTTKKTMNGYKTIYNPSTNDYKVVHRLVADHYGLNLNHNVIHHIDFNKLNNTPENLDCSMTFWEHRDYHKLNANLTINSEFNINKRKAFYATPEGKLTLSNAGKIGGKISGEKLKLWHLNNDVWNKGMKSGCDVACYECGKLIYQTQNIRKFCSKSCEITFRSKMFNRSNNLGITFEYLIENANRASSIKQLADMLSIDKNTLSKLISDFGFSSNKEFIISYMPSVVSNRYSGNNFHLTPRNGIRFECKTCHAEFFDHAERKTCSRKCLTEYKMLQRAEKLKKMYPIDMLIQVGMQSNSFKEMSSILKVHPKRGITELFDIYNISKSEFIYKYMPLALKNIQFMNNYTSIKNHKVVAVNYLTDTIDTGDITITNYHNFAVESGVFVHNSALASEDYQFGRTIQRIQQAVVQELNKIAIVHLIALGFDEDDCENFELQMANPSYLIDSQKIEIIQARSQLVDTLVQGKYMDKKTALIDFLNFTEDKFEQIRAGLIDDARFEKKLEAVASEEPDTAGGESDDQLGDFGDEDYGAEPEADAGGDEPMPEPREGEATEDGGDGQPEIPTEPKAGVGKKKGGKKELQKSSTDLVKKRRKKVFDDPMKQVTYNPLKTIDFGKISQMKIPKESALLGEVVNVSTELNEYVETITEELNINGDEPKELWQE